MKTVGLIGGIGPESTIEYYRSIIASYREQKPDGGYPAILLNSVNLTQLLEWMSVNDLEKVTENLILEAEKLAKAGVDLVRSPRTHNILSFTKSSGSLVFR